MRDTVAKSFTFFKAGSRQLILLAVATSFVIAGIKMYNSGQVRSQYSSTTPEPQLSIPKVKTVTALGRLEPKGKVIKLSAPAFSQGSRVDQLLVKQGNQVKAGQIIAILDNRDRLQAALQEAKEGVKVSQINLAKVLAGAKLGEIEAQKAEVARIQAQTLGEQTEKRETVARLKAEWEGEKIAQQATIKKLEIEVKNAQIEFQRYLRLYQEGAISQSLFDSKRLNVDTITQQLQEAKAIFNKIDNTGKKQISETKAVLGRIKATGSKEITSATANLNRIAEVRPIDVAAAKAEVNRAIASEQQAKANLEQSYVRSPENGIIIDIHTRSGEMVSNDGIVEIAQINQMYAVLEVYQSDVSKVLPNQQVSLSSNSLPDELQGTVDWVGWKVQRQNVVNTDPSENIDSRVVEVHVQLDELSSQKASKFTNLQVKAVITL